MYNLSSSITKENSDFKSTVTPIAQPLINSTVSNGGLGGSNSLDVAQGYLFSHYNMVNLIDSFMYSRFFESTQLDENGGKKLFFNIVYFAYEVAMKNIKLSPSNFIFNPEEGEEIVAELARHCFRDYMRKNTTYGEDLQNVMESLNSDFVKYGTCVSMRRDNKIERVPLKSIRITPTARSINDAITNGGYFIIEKQTTYQELLGYEDYKIKDIDYFAGIKPFYVRYGRVPRKYYEAWLTDTHDDIEITDEDMKDQIITLACVVDVKKKDKSKKIVWMEEISEDDIPFDECHYHRVDGRWLGRGAVEVILEHQIAINFTINEQRKALLWSSKKLFTTRSKTISRNLIREAKNGQIFYVVDGEINQVPMESRSLPELTNFMEAWKSGANESTFTFEAISGDTLPSGTPFRLGAMMTNNAMMFYKMKQEKLGTFYRQLFYNNLIPIFKDKYSGKVRISAHSHISTTLMSTYLQTKVADGMYEEFISGNGGEMNPAEVRQKIIEDLAKHHDIYIELGDKPFAMMRSELDVELTNNEINVQSQVESLQSWYQVLKQANDPRAEQVIQKVLGFSNISTANFGQVMQSMGLMPQTPQQGQPQPQEAGMQMPPNPNQGATNPAQALMGQ